MYVYVRKLMNVYTFICANMQQLLMRVHAHVCPVYTVYVRIQINVYTFYWFQTLRPPGPQTQPAPYVFVCVCVCVCVCVYVCVYNAMQRILNHHNLTLHPQTYTHIHTHTHIHSW